MSFNQLQISDAETIYKYFVGKGWTPQAACGLIGNVQTESILYANIWEGGTAPGTGSGPGYGLVQWTPASKLFNWCQSRGLDPSKIENQCACIEYEMLNGIQFGPSASYNMTSTEYIQSTESAYNLGLVWLANYERPHDSYQPWRGQQAQYWYDQLSGIEVPSNQTPIPTPNPSNSGNPIEYTVQAGDTLSGIAFKYGVTVNNLEEWNDISDPNYIYVGEVLYIYTSGTTNSNNNSGNLGSTETYTIQPGDTLSGIAEQFNVTVADLERWNNISNPNLIYAGQVLTIYIYGGGPKGGGIIVYTIQAGDTLSSIAEKFNVTVTELEQWNDISNPNLIYAGQVLTIYSKGGGGGGGVIQYTIQPGDTLSSIAEKFNVNISELEQWNNISNPNLIYAGQVLTIYTAGNNGGGTSTYTVQPGDTLSGIAEQFGVTVSDLQQWNNLANVNLIYAGEVLVV